MRPDAGSGTSGDAAAAPGLRYKGFDLQTGFDAARHDLLSATGEPIGSCFIHPAYAGMSQFSGKVWGRSNRADLSQVGRDIDAYNEMLQAVLQNVYRALKPGACYGVLLGCWRTGGQYHHLPSQMLGYAPGKHVAEITKLQHNVASDATAYSGDFVPIRHETLLVMRRQQDGSIFAITAATLDAVNRVYAATWRNLVLGFARERETFTLDDLYRAFAEHPRTGANANYQAKLRQVVASEAHLRRYARGRYAYLENPEPKAERAS